MKLFVLFCILVAVAAEPIVKSWTLNELSTVLEKKKADPIIRPYLEDALNKIMLAIYTGNDAQSVYAALASPTGTVNWTMAELNKTIANLGNDLIKSAPLRQSRNMLLRMIESGKPQDSIPVWIPALDVSLWTQDDVSKAIEDTNTKSALKPYLEQASNKFKQASASGIKLEKVGMVTTVGIFPMKPGQSEFLPAPPLSLATI